MINRNDYTPTSHGIFNTCLAVIDQAVRADENENKVELKIHKIQKEILLLIMHRHRMTCDESIERCDRTLSYWHQELAVLANQL